MAASVFFEAFEKHINFELKILSFQSCNGRFGAKITVLPAPIPCRRFHKQYFRLVMHQEA